MKRALFIAFGFFIALLGVGWWYFFYTTAGINFVLARIGTLKSVHIEVADVSGHLAGPIAIKHLRIEQKTVHIEADDVRLELSPSALFLQTLQVDKLSASHVDVRISNSQSTDTAIPIFFPSFLHLDAKAIDVTAVRVMIGEDFVQSADRVHARVRLTSRRIQVDDADVVAPAYSAHGIVSIQSQRPLHLDVNARVNFPAPRGPRFDANVALSGPLNKLDLDAALLTPSAARLKGVIVREQGWQLRGTLSSELFVFNPWVERPSFSLHKLTMNVDASPDDIHLVGSVIVPEVDAAPLGVDLHGQYSNRVAAITRGEVRPAKSDMVVITAARLDFTAGKPVVAATAQWSNFRWPLRAQYFVSPQGQVSLSGALPFAIGVDATVNTQLQVGGQILAHGALSSDGIEFDEATLGTLGGEIKGAARLNFSPAHEWRAAVTGRNIDPKSLYAQAPGKIDFKVDANGAGLDRRAKFAMSLSQLSGTLRGERIDGHGYLAHDAGGWSAKEFSASLGANRFAASGEWREKINIAWSLEVPALEKFFDTASGALRFLGTAHGTSKRPQIAGSLIGTRLRYGSWNASDLLLAGNIDLSDQLASQLELNATRIGWDDIYLDALHAHAQGKSTAHTLQLNATSMKNGAFTKISTRVEGGYNNDVWQGRLAPLAFADGDGKAPTAQANDAHVVWSRKQRSLDNGCLLWTSHRLCANGAWQPQGAWRVDAESDALPLNAFNGTFPDGAQYQGSWQVRAHFSGNATTPWIGQASVDVNNASLAFQPIAGAEELVFLGSGRVDVSAHADRFLADLRITKSGTTNITASARIDRDSNVPFMQSPLSGEFNASTTDANLLPLIFADLDHSAGELTAQLRAGGTPASPVLQGQIDLQKGELDLYRYNLSVRDLNTTARINDNRLSFEGAAHIGDGKLAMQGSLAWRNLEPVGKLHMQGENLLVANLPEYRIAASPNVDFEIEGKRVTMRGEVTIPSAHLEPHDLRGAVQTSRDVRLVGEIPEPPLKGFDVHTEVRVRIGQDVQLDTYGLQGKLGGSVMIVSQGPSASGTGELNVSDGRYEAYGQKLNIARGRLIFEASPLDNPGLDIQAARKIEDSDQRVGVNVRGTLRDPRVTLFSDPALPQSQIVSMLLTGKPIADLSSKDAAAVGAAQTDLRLQGGSLVASQIGRRLGLTDVSIESTGLNDTALVLGKFLSPRLFVSYGISLTESINTLKLRYTISDRWSIRTEAGQNQSADIQFRVER